MSVAKEDSIKQSEWIMKDLRVLVERFDDAKGIVLEDREDLNHHLYASLAHIRQFHIKLKESQA